MKRSVVAGFGFAAMMVPQMALAHPGHGGTSFTAGLIHPLTGADHLLAMLLVGVGAAVFVRRNGWMLPVGFLVALTVGFATFALLPGAVAEAGILASLVVLGMATALRLDTPAPVAMLAVMVFGYAHGAAHGAETPSGALPWLFAAGFLAASTALHLGGYALARVLPDRALQLIGMGSAGLGLVLAVA